jgi:hypothetical protein
MKASQFSDADICRKAGNQPGDLLQLEEEVRGPSAVGNEAAEAARCGASTPCPWLVRVC